MDRITLIAKLRTYDRRFRESGASAVYVYGSRARDDFRPDSDVDLFIEYLPSVKVPNLFDLVQIELELGRELGTPVSISTRDALHPLMRETISREAIRVL